jgi:Mg2+-importing ATPase
MSQTLPARRALLHRASSPVGRDPRDALAAYWALSAEELSRCLSSGSAGLSEDQAVERRHTHGANVLEADGRLSWVAVFWAQLKSPLLLLLVFAAAASALSGELLDAVIVASILVVSVAVGFTREYRAHKAAAALRSRVRTSCRVVRGGKLVSIPSDDVVPGDVVALEAGSLVPADAVLLEATDCHVSQATLTGESFPVEKRAGAVSLGATLAERTNCVFLGTNVQSGTARALVVRTGRDTELGSVAHKLTLRPPETEFERGVRRFGYLLTVAMLVMVLVVFAAHVLQGRPAIETLLFAIALAVGLSPELLPAILSVNLARSASAMARRGVLVRRLDAIENLGSMDVLCTDKTGTLTEGVVRLSGAYDADGAESKRVLDLAALNAALEAGLKSPLDDAILSAAATHTHAQLKLAEVPFDFVRKRVSVVVREGEGARLITKGAFEQLLAACTTTAAGSLDDPQRARIDARFRELAAGGTRVLGVATRTLLLQSSYGRKDEEELCFEGFLTFLDRPKPGVRETLAQLAGLGVRVKLISGDARLVAEHVARLVGLDVHAVLTGKDLDELHDEALWRLATDVDVFAEVDPNQKERIILALRKSGHVVGFMGDGVNDAPAMHAADTSISVESAVDVAREAADFVLLEHDLDVVRRGIEAGRRTFANTLKYVLTTTSANLGNMVSMALASLVLPFLPLLAGQILLNNLLSDIPAVGIADDSVDPELIAKPRRWNMRFIGRFMVEFGLLSSLFDFLTFGVLLWLFRATAEEFRTAWFVESLLTELAIALVVRTRRPLFLSRPGGLLWRSSLALFVITPLIPYVPGASVLGFTPLPMPVLSTILAITACYVLAAEAAKRWFYRPRDGRSQPGWA